MVFAVGGTLKFYFDIVAYGLNSLETAGLHKPTIQPTAHYLVTESEDFP